jgi:AraC family transcriptional regulator
MRGREERGGAAVAATAAAWSFRWSLPPQAGWSAGAAAWSGAPAPFPAAPAPARGLDRRRLQRVLDYVESRLDRDISLAELSAVACLSKFHFARAFKAATGVSPHRHVSARRLERAKALLREGVRPLLAIALECRFSSQANFSRAFRQAVGMTPGQYRAAARRSGT